MISFVIPNWNGMAYLKACIESIVNADSGGVKKEIVVVDNASFDGSTEMVENLFPEVKLLRNSTNTGYAQAVNQGVKITSGEYIFLLNNDVVLLKGTILPLINKLKSHDDVGAVAPLLIYPDGRLQISCRRFPWPFEIILEKVGIDGVGRFRRLKLSDQEHLQGGRVDQPMFSAIMIKRQCWNQVGSLDENFPIFFNDVEWCYRLYKKTKYVIFLVPEAKAIHHEGVSVNKLGRRKKYHLYRGLLRFYSKTLKMVFSILLCILV
ncbi:MAG: glycosyltransferase family 2 protein [Nitrospirae bacterium]|nr:MAG: glycosyltransferase family 2 protein [Nitrospirota bacterium]